MGKENASGIIHGADIDHFAQIILGSDKNGICQILKIVKFHLEKQNVFLSAMVVTFLIALLAGIVTFLKRCRFPAYIENERATEKKQSEFPVDLTIGVLNDTKIDEIESFICSIRSYFDINIEIFIVSLEPETPRGGIPCKRKITGYRPLWCHN